MPGLTQTLIEQLQEEPLDIEECRTQRCPPEIAMCPQSIEALRLSPSSVPSYSYTLHFSMADCLVKTLCKK